MQHTIEFPAVALKNALAGLSKIISSKSTLPVLGCIRVEADANGYARFQVTDLDSFATGHLQAANPGRFPACLIPFDPLNRIVKGAKNALRLVQEDGKVSVQSSFGTATVAQSLTTHPLKEWPVVPAVPAPTLNGEAAFKKALREALECASTDSSRHVINGACLDLTQPGCHSVVGTDGRHLFSANTFQFDLPQSVIVPNRKFLAWSGFNADGNWRVGVLIDKKGEPEWLELQSDHWSIVTKPISGNYPNWRQVVPTEDRNVTRVTLSEESVGLMLDALPRLPGGDDLDQPVTLIIASGQFRLAAQGKDDKQASEVPVPGVEVTGPDVQLRLNRSFVSKALRFGFTAFELTDALSPILFTAPGRKLVAMPLRLESATPQKPSPQPTAEAAAAATPSAEQPQETTTEKRNTMPTETTLTPPRRGNIQPTVEANNNNGHNGSALSVAVTQIETVKTGLRDVIIELNATLDLLRAAEREKKVSAKEVESVRATLRSLQKVAI
jgi:DNA polymerase III sliding clamp (beta) subunit (PCNA family)